MGRRIDIQAHHLPTVAELFSGKKPTQLARERTRILRYFRVSEYIGSSAHERRVHQSKKRRAYKTYADIRDSDMVMIHSRRDLICKASNSNDHCPPECPLNPINNEILTSNNSFVDDILTYLHTHPEEDDGHILVQERMQYKGQETQEKVLSMSGKVFRRVIPRIYT